MELYPQVIRVLSELDRRFDTDTDSTESKNTELAVRGCLLVEYQLTCDQDRELQCMRENTNSTPYMRWSDCTVILGDTCVEQITVQDINENMEYLSSWMLVSSGGDVHLYKYCVVGKHITDWRQLSGVQGGQRTVQWSGGTQGDGGSGGHRCGCGYMGAWKNEIGVVYTIVFSRSIMYYSVWGERFQVETKTQVMNDITGGGHRWGGGGTERVGDRGILLQGQGSLWEAREGLSVTVNVGDGRRWDDSGVKGDYMIWHEILDMGTVMRELCGRCTIPDFDVGGHNVLMDEHDLINMYKVHGVVRTGVSLTEHIKGVEGGGERVYCGGHEGVKGCTSRGIGELREIQKFLMHYCDGSIERYILAAEVHVEGNKKSGVQINNKQLIGHYTWMRSSEGEHEMGDLLHTRYVDTEKNRRDLCYFHGTLLTGCVGLSGLHGVIIFSISRVLDDTLFEVIDMMRCVFQMRGDRSVDELQQRTSMVVSVESVEAIDAVWCIYVLESDVRLDSTGQVHLVIYTKVSSSVLEFMYIRVTRDEYYSSLVQLCLRLYLHVCCSVDESLALELTLSVAHIVEDDKHSEMDIDKTSQVGWTTEDYWDVFLVEIFTGVLYCCVCYLTTMMMMWHMEVVGHDDTLGGTVHVECEGRVSVVRAWEWERGVLRVLGMCFRGCGYESIVIWQTVDTYGQIGDMHIRAQVEFTGIVIIGLCLLESYNLPGSRRSGIGVVTHCDLCADMWDVHGTLWSGWLGLASVVYTLEGYSVSDLRRGWRGLVTLGASSVSGEGVYVAYSATSERVRCTWDVSENESLGFYGISTCGGEEWIHREIGQTTTLYGDRRTCHYRHTKIYVTGWSQHALCVERVI
ncbi:hypothetical protein Tco_1335785 [Tanacetum coccineum]